MGEHNGIVRCHAAQSSKSARLSVLLRRRRLPPVPSSLHQELESSGNVHMLRLASQPRVRCQGAAKWVWPQKVEMEPAASGRFKKAGFRAMEQTKPTTVNAVIGTPPGSFDWPMPISQPWGVGCALCTAAHCAPGIALDLDVMPQAPELPSANDQALRQPTLWYHLHSRELLVGSGCSRSPAATASLLGNFPAPPRSPPSASE